MAGAGNDPDVPGPDVPSRPEVPAGAGASDQPPAPRRRGVPNIPHTAAVKERYVQVRDRVDATAAGQVRRRVRDLDVLNHGVILASLGLTLLIPALITISAVLPVGSKTGLAATVIRRFGLSTQAADDLRKVFPTRNQVAGTTTVMSAVATLFWALGWPTELARGYQSIWELPGRGLRDMWRSVPWLLSFMALIAAIILSSSMTSGFFGVFAGVGLLGVPVLFLWSWWSQHLLLAGRISWRALLPSAVATTIALFLFGVGMNIYVPHAIISNSRQYGPMGVIFVLLTWLAGFAVAVLGGSLVGHTFYLRRQMPPDTSAPPDAEAPPDGRDAPAADPPPVQSG